MEIIIGMAGAILAILLSLLGVERRRTARERKAKEKAEDERDKLRVVATVRQQADRIKDTLAGKQKDSAKAREEVIRSIEEIPEKEEVPLSDKVKKLAADQSARARARAKRVPDQGR